MSALAHYLEDSGIATTLVSLIRLHSEKIEPPRALWVPFELGRPLGEPGNAAFQTRVLRSTLALLESDAGSPLLEDFADDAPGENDAPGWQSPSVNGAHDLFSELAGLRPAYDGVVKHTGRTTVGVSGLRIEDSAAYLAAFDTEQPQPNPHEDMSDLLLMRFAADDVKAYYTEAATAGNAVPSSKQLGKWFWNETIAGKTLRALRERSLEHEDAKRQTIGGRFLIPRLWL